MLVGGRFEAPNVSSQVTLHFAYGLACIFRDLGVVA